MTNLQAYEALTAANVHWTRISPKMIRVYMSSDGNGSHHENLDKISEFLKQASMFEFNRDFDVVCGKGFCDYKHKETV